jgi:uncharacterized protein
MLRFDSVDLPLANVRKLAAGGIAIPALLCRSGIQSYQRADGTVVREYRPPEEVFAADTLASFELAPVTVGHPRKDVSPENWSVLAHGVTRVSNPKPELIEGEGYLSAEVAVTRADTQAKVLAKEYEGISVGYSADIDPTPGVSPAGEPYDQVQRNIRANHVALLTRNEKPRAGRHARLRLDGEAELMEEDFVKKVNIDGVEYEVGSDAHVSALTNKVAKAEARADAAEAALKETKAEASKAEARADAAEASASAEALAAKVDEEVKFRAAMTPTLPKDYDFSGKTRHAVRLDALEALKVTVPETRRDCEVYVEARLDAALVAPAEAPKHDYNKSPRKDSSQSDAAEKSAAELYQAFLARVSGAETGAENA